MMLLCGAAAQVPQDTMRISLSRSLGDGGLGLNLDLGMYIVEVDAPSPASEAGMQVGMRLSSINGDLYLDREDVLVVLSQPGVYNVHVHLACLRFTDAYACSGDDCAWDTTNSKCAPRSLFPHYATPPSKSPSKAPTSLLPGGQDRVFSIFRASDAEPTGFVADGALVVNQVDTGSAAQTAGLRSGMKVSQVNGQAVSTIIEMQAALLQASTSFSLTVVMHCTIFRSAALCNAARDAPEYRPGCYWSTNDNACVGWNGQSTASPQASIRLQPQAVQFEGSQDSILGLPIGGFVGLVVGVVVLMTGMVVLVWYYCVRKDDIDYQPTCDASDVVYEISPPPCYEDSVFEDGEMYGASATSDGESEGVDGAMASDIALECPTDSPNDRNRFRAEPGGSDVVSLHSQSTANYLDRYAATPTLLSVMHPSPSSQHNSARSHGPRLGSARLGSARRGTRDMVQASQYEVSMQSKTPMSRSQSRRFSPAASQSRRSPAASQSRRFNNDVPPVSAPVSAKSGRWSKRWNGYDAPPATWA